ncbi:unnamed protein product [Toxocara canis]|uniref:Ovule protein n=1 Tax=Toxocara canis TaxID=6265 RepID=A0A183VE18_TOXCA|nr:unnamed protein product [Toxocara canis]
MKNKTRRQLGRSVSSVHTPTHSFQFERKQKVHTMKTTVLRKKEMHDPNIRQILVNLAAAIPSQPPRDSKDDTSDIETKRTTFS